MKIMNYNIGALIVALVFAVSVCMIPQDSFAENDSSVSAHIQAKRNSNLYDFVPGELITYRLKIWMEDDGGNEEAGINNTTMELTSLEGFHLADNHHSSISGRYFYIEETADYENNTLNIDIEKRKDGVVSDRLNVGDGQIEIIVWMYVDDDVKTGDIMRLNAKLSGLTDDNQYVEDEVQVEAVVVDDFVLFFITNECLTPAEDILPGELVLFRTSAWMEAQKYHDEDCTAYPYFSITPYEGLLCDEEQDCTLETDGLYLIYPEVDMQNNKLEIPFQIDDGEYIWDEWMPLDGEITVYYYMRVADNAKPGESLSCSAKIISDLYGDLHREKEAVANIVVAGEIEPEWCLVLVNYEETSISMRYTYRFEMREEV